MCVRQRIVPALCHRRPAPSPVLRKPKCFPLWLDTAPATKMVILMWRERRTTEGMVEAAGCALACFARDSPHSQGLFRGHVPRFPGTPSLWFCRVPSRAGAGLQVGHPALSVQPSAWRPCVTLEPSLSHCLHVWPVARGGPIHPHLTGEEIEAWHWQVTCLRSHTGYCGDLA